MGRPHLTLAGPYEFRADDPWLYGAYASELAKKDMPGEEEAKTALAAYSLLGFDMGWLSPKAAAWFRRYTGTTPSGFREVGGEPVSRTISTPVGKIGLVLFPEGPVQGKAPSPDQEQAALAAGRALRDTCALVVGISPWGYVGERDFLPKAAGIYNVLMGGGEGVGFSHSLSDRRPGLVWLRPDTQGRALSVLEIRQLPGKNFVWKENETFRAKLEWLGDDVRPDPAMAKIVGE